MAKEKLTLTEADKKLISAIEELTTQTPQEIESYLMNPDLRANYLASIKTLAEQKAATANQVLELLK